MYFYIFIAFYINIFRNFNTSYNFYSLLHWRKQPNLRSLPLQSFVVLDKMVNRELRLSLYSELSFRGSLSQKCTDLDCM